MPSRKAGGAGTWGRTRSSGRSSWPRCAPAAPAASAMTKTLRGLRGATTAAANTREAILNATAELLRALQEANGFRPGDVESAIFTSSPDLTAEYPARAARVLGSSDVPLLGTAEV